MKLLIFANSDSEGRVISGRAWPALVRERVEEATGERVDLVERPLSPVGSGAVDYGERVAVAEQPDVVILPLVTYSFAIEFVAPRVRQLLGERVWRGYRKVEQAFDERTKQHGLLRPANTFARRAARRVIGVAPHGSPDRVAATYADIVRRLSRLEELHVIAMTYPRFGREIERANPGIAARNAQFEDAVRRVVAEHRFGWADGQRAVAEAGLGERAVAADGFHLSEAGHGVYAEMLAPLVLAAAGPLPSSSHAGVEPAQPRA